MLDMVEKIEDQLTNMPDGPVPDDIVYQIGQFVVLIDDFCNKYTRDKWHKRNL